jgi:glycosyltransferase involved in cell wall biosynthesis
VSGVLRVALVGSRGIPARYGGYETLCDELAPRLVARGFDVTVYGRAHYVARRRRERRGARLVVLPTLRGKHLDTPVHTLLSCLHAMGERFDAALMVNSANALFVPLLELAGTPVALNVDGIEKRRAKWGRFGRAVYALSERLAATLPSALVTDAEVIAAHYRARYAAASTVITYGVAPPPHAGTRTLRRLKVEPRRYALYVSRFEPENNPHRIAAGFRLVRARLPLVMVGGAPYADDFIASFTRDADPRILFPGAIYGRGYRQLLAHAFVYVHATEVGGTHPALVEALGYGNCCLVHDTRENRETAGDAAIYFRAEEPGSLAAAIDRLVADPAEVERLRRAAARRAQELYDWERIADAYAALFGRLAGRAPGAAYPRRRDPVAAT